MIRYTYVSPSDPERQVFEGTYKGYRFVARFGEHLLTIDYKGASSTFIEGDGWKLSESTRKAIIEEFLLWG
jgi:hypothetical protein